MITLPSLKVYRDESAERELWDRARAWLARGDSERKDGIHASDLLMPRRGYWRRRDPKAPTEREIGLYLVGKVLHAFILSELTGGLVDLTLTDEGSLFSQELGIWYSPDKLGQGVPVEIKTSRGMYPAKSVEDLETYIAQVLVYMAARGVTEGRIVVMYTNAKDEARKTSPQFRVYQVHILPEELAALKLDIRRQRDDLVAALAAGDHTKLPVCPAWACHPEQCAWWHQCQPPGRYENREYLESKRK